MNHIAMKFITVPTTLFDDKNPDNIQQVLTKVRVEHIVAYTDGYDRLDETPGKCINIILQGGYEVHANMSLPDFENELHRVLSEIFVHS